MEKNKHKRIYVIEYDFYIGVGGKYSDPPKCEKNVCYFDKFQRDEFLKKYLSLKNSKTYGINIDNIKCYTAILEEIENMDKVINSI